MKKATVSEFVGVDVAKARLDVHFHVSNEACSFPNDAAGVQELARLCASRGVRRVVFESTGALGRPLMKALVDVQVPVSCVPPQRVHQFAKAMGVKAKTDKIDARVIAHYAATAPLSDGVPVSSTAERLRDLLVRREQLVTMETRERNHRASGLVAVDAVDLLAALKSNIAAIDKMLKSLVSSDAKSAKRSTVLRTVKGVGPVLSQTLLAMMPELGRCSGKEAASLVGVAPFNDDSAARRGKRSIRGGRGRIRRVLYMASLTVMRYEPIFKAVYERIIAQGKPAKVAITAVMRKLIVVLNARMRDALALEAGA